MSRVALVLAAGAVLGAALPSPGLFAAIGLGIGAIGTGWPNSWQIVIDFTFSEFGGRAGPSAIQWVLQRGDGSWRIRGSS